MSSKKVNWQERYANGVKLLEEVLEEMACTHVCSAGAGLCDPCELWYRIQDFLDD